MTAAVPAAIGPGVLSGVIRNHPWLAAALVALVLAMKIVVPGGFMPAAQSGKLVILVCSGLGMEPVAVDIGGKPAKPDGATRTAAQPCVFAALADLWLPGADPVQLRAALLFILALGFAAISAPALARLSRLRPPLRGPPLPA
jgi:hypothetical protein